MSKPTCKKCGLPFRGASIRMARHTEPVIEKGIWVMIDGPEGVTSIPADLVDLDEVRALIRKMNETDEPLTLSGTSLEDYARDNEFFDLSIEEGYGAWMSAPGYLDRTETAVFDTEEEALEYLKEYHMDPAEYPEFFEKETAEDRFGTEYEEWEEADYRGLAPRVPSHVRRDSAARIRGRDPYPPEDEIEGYEELLPRR